MPKPQPSYMNKVDQIPPEVVDKLIFVYQKENLTLTEIAAKMDMEWWTIKTEEERAGIWGKMPGVFSLKPLCFLQNRVVGEFQAAVDEAGPLNQTAASRQGATRSQKRSEL